VGRPLVEVVLGSYIRPVRVARVRMLTTVLVVALSTACGADDSPQPAPSPTVGEPTPELILPLTGLPATGGVPERPALVVKVDNTARSRPQLGLSSADLVVEELVEGGLTRLAVMYHSTLPSIVAPVRSVRTTDIGIVAPTGGALVASGGARRVLQAIDAAGITVLTSSEAGLSRDPSRRAPYDVALDPTAAVAAANGLPAPAVSYLPWAHGDAPPPAGTPATSAAVTFSGGHTTHWQLVDGAWHRVDDLAADGDQFRAANLLVLRVTTRDAGYRDPAGNPVPETVIEGSGQALLLAGGQVVSCSWSKASAAAPFRLADASGADLGVPPGRTWIELVPEAGSVQTS
jgi:hypothetical protein